MGHAEFAIDNALEKYNYLSGLTRRGWAWEHLRRDPDFRQAAFFRQKDAIKIDRYCHNIHVIDLLRPQPEAEYWGLIFFPNPDQSAIEADVFWSEASYPNHIRVNVSPRQAGEIDEIFEASARLTRIRQLTDLEGREHILIQGDNCAIQVRAYGLSLRSTHPVKMTFDLSGPSQMEQQFKLIKQARKAYSPCSADNLIWSPKAERLRNGLIALDVIEAGMPLRSAAEIIYGKERVDEDWQPHKRAMKDRLRSQMEAARKLRDGGYRTLLQK